MNYFGQYQKNLTNPIIKHITIPLIELNSQGKEIVKGKKLIVNLSQDKPRSSSVQNTLRHIFKIPQEKKDKTKSFLPSYTTTVSEIKKSNVLSAKKVDNYNEIQYLNELCQQMVKENPNLKKKLEDQEKILQNYSKNDGKCLSPDGSIGKNKIILKKISPLRTSLINEERNDSLITFRPNITPSRQKFRFPREIFN